MSPKLFIRLFSIVFLYNIQTVGAQNEFEISGPDDSDAIIFDNGGGAIRNHFDVIRWERDFFKILLDSDNNQTNARFSIFRDVNQSVGTLATINFSLDGDDSWLDSGGRWGINTTSPTQALSINGALTLGKAEISSLEAGTIRYNSSAADFEGYNGTHWLSLTGFPAPPPLPTYEVGDYAEGGVVFWVAPDGSQIKVIHLGEFTGSWMDPSNSLVSASDNLDGQSNSLLIANHPDHISSAAKICLDLSVNAIADWYLPAINELVELVETRGIINPTLEAYLGDLVHSNYWSSTEVNSTEAKATFFDIGTLEIEIVDLMKHAGNYDFRAIRTVDIN